MLLVEHRVVIIPDIQKDPRFRYKAQAAAAGINAEVIIPMYNSRDTWGTLMVVCRDSRHFRQDELDALVTYAEQAAIAIENARLVHEVEARTVTMAQINAELETKNSELERFVYTISHELKSPLVTIQGFLGFVKQDLSSGKPKRAHDDLNRIADAATTMERLLDNLLTMSRIGRVINPPERVSLEALAHEVGDTLTPQIVQRGVEMRIAPNLPEVYGDPIRLRELLHNLLENAIKFLGDQRSPWIEMGMRAEDQEWVYYVRDNGIGIAPRYHDKVFGLFERLAPDSDGTGIGLALVHRIIEVHGGRIWVESKGEGQGCTICFTLPEKVSKKGGVGGPVALASGYENTYPLPNRPE